MREHRIRAKQRRGYRPQTTRSSGQTAVAPNLLSRRFDAGVPDWAWVADITYIATDEGWLYLAAVLDLGTRMIVGWATSRRLTRQLTLRSLMMAQQRRRPAAGLIHHSDQGSQYASDQYQAALASCQMLPSMSRKGNCWDNAMIESFFCTLKIEEVNDARYGTREDAKRSLYQYIERFYNTKRRHSSLNYKTPAEAMKDFKRV